MTTSNAEQQGKSLGRKRRGWKSRVLRALLLLVVIAIVGHTAWGCYAVSTFNAMIADHRMRGEPILIADFTFPTVADDQNAALLLRDAAESINRNTATWKAFEIRGNAQDFPMTAEEVQLASELVDENTLVLELCHLAAGKPSVDWGIRFTDPAMHTDLDPIGSQRHVGTVLMAAYVTDVYRSDYAAAIGRIEDLLALSRSVDEFPTVVSHLISLGTSAQASSLATSFSRELMLSATSPPPSANLTGGNALGPPLPRTVTAQQVGLLIAQLLDESHLLINRRRAIEGERAVQLDLIESIVDGSLAFDGVASPPRESEQRAAGLIGYLLRPVALTDGILLAARATAYRDAYNAADYPTFRSLVPAELAENIKSRRIAHPFASLLAVNFERVGLQDYKQLADRRMAATCLAIRLYAHDHGGRFPEQLADLVPRYLPSVPMDPMAAGRPLGYRNTPQDPIVYSVSEDGRDDGGFVPAMTARRADWLAKSDEVRHLTTPPRTEGGVIDDDRLWNGPESVPGDVELPEVD